MTRKLAVILLALTLAVATPWVALTDTTRVPALGGSGATGTFSTSVVIGAADAANSVVVATGAPSTMCWEGATADAFETCITAADPTVGDQTWTIPNSAGAVARTFASLEASGQVFSGASQIFGTQVVLNTDADITFITGGSYNNGRIAGNAILTPDGMRIAPGATSNSVRFNEALDNFDFNNGPCGTAACADPTFIISSSVQDITQYSAISVTGATGGWIKALTGGAATAVLRIPVASGAGTGGTLCYTVFASDATEHQTRSACVRIAVENKAGTEVCGLSATSEVLDLSAVAVSAGTLTYTIACDTSPTNAVDITFNAVSSLTETTLNFYGHLTLTGPGLPARQ